MNISKIQYVSYYVQITRIWANFHHQEEEGPVVAWNLRRPSRKWLFETSSRQDGIFQSCLWWQNQGFHWSFPKQAHSVVRTLNWNIKKCKIRLCRNIHANICYGNWAVTVVTVVVVGAVVNISSLCHQEFWVHHMVELLPSELATDQRTPTHRDREKKTYCRTT